MSLAATRHRYGLSSTSKSFVTTLAEVLLWFSSLPFLPLSVVASTLEGGRWQEWGRGGGGEVYREAGADGEKINK